MSAVHTVTVPRKASASPLAALSAESYIEGLNAFMEAKAQGRDCCRIGQSLVIHRLELVSHADGRITLEPACRTGYWGESSERVHAVSSLAPGVPCGKQACIRDTPGRRAPRYSPRLRASQLELELTVG